MSFRNRIRKLLPPYRKMGIRVMISISFTAVTVIGMFLLCGMLILRFSNATRILQQDTSQRMIEQINQQMDSYLRNIMQLSDTIYYRVLKNSDFRNLHRWTHWNCCMKKTAAIWSRYRCLKKPVRWLRLHRSTP